MMGGDEAKCLEDYSAREVAALINQKGQAFHQLAGRIREADLKGSFLAQQLSRGEGRFDDFLREKAGIADSLIRLSVFGTLQEVPRRS